MSMDPVLLWQGTIPLTAETIWTTLDEASAIADADSPADYFSLLLPHIGRCRHE